jgi:hypothetical protein
VAHIMGEIHKSMATTEWNSHARCPRTIMSIMQHSTLE